MDPCQIDCVDELKIQQDVQHETNMKSIKHIGIKKNIIESDHRAPKRKHDISNSNTLKKKKKYETALAAIFPENDQSYLQYAQDYAEGYMKKMRERLDTESFDIAVKLLASFGVADDSNIKLLFQQITELFTNKNEDLIYEFLGFLLPGQALSIGKFTDYLELTRIKEFIRKLQVCMKKQPTQVRKILDNLLNLSKSENISPLEVHSVMLPLLKSNPILVDCFFQLIPTERPPESFFSDDNWEDLNIDQSINYGIDYEEIIPFDSEDQTHLNVCHCTCHKFGDITHCRSCGLKFFKGRIYFDTPEGLKLAKISFEGADPLIVQSKVDKTEVNVAIKQKKRSGLIKNSSPGSAEDIKGSTGTESEEDLIEIKPKKRQKSKVVQSLKLKFKKEESPKYKDDQEAHNELGKSVVHVTNEELNTSEMVFFYIPEKESNVKTSKKKLKHDIKESLQQKKCETGNQINSETSILNNLNTVLSEINTENFLDINTVNNVSKELEIESNFILPDVTINNLATETERNAASLIVTNDDLNNVSKKIQIDSNFILSVQTNNFTKIKTESNTMPSVVINNDVNITSNEIKTENNIMSSTMPNIDNTLSNEIKSENYAASQSNIIDVISEINILNEQCHSLKEIKIESTNHPSVISSTHQPSSNALSKNEIKIEFIRDSNSYYSNNENGRDDQNISTKSMANCDFSLSIPDANKTLLDESLSVEKTDYCFSTTDASIPSKSNGSLFDENIIKSESIESLSECYIDVKKQQNNESEKQLTNKWTIDEDKIILQTCKRVEDIEVLLETINRRIPQRSVSEIQERFTTLMTLLEQMIDVKEN